MLEDIVYWTEYYFRKNNVEARPIGGISDSLFIVSVCVIFNLLTIVYITEYHTEWRILQYLPINSKKELGSWVYAILLLFPILVLIYWRYYRGGRLRKILNDYEKQPNEKIRLGKLTFWVYQICTWGGFIFSYILFKH